MNTSTVTLPESTFNANQRRNEVHVPTNVPNVYLTVTTSHSDRSYWSRIDRISVKDGILTMKIDAARFQDLPPVAGRKLAAKRYSAKNLQQAHEDFVATFDADTLAEAITWAERY